MLAMGRALMSRPRLLLLDEPSMGLAPLMVQKVFETIVTVSAEGVTILLIEQNAKLALEVSHRGYVMESGEITLSGDVREAAARSGRARRVPRRGRPPGDARRSDARAGSRRAPPFARRAPRSRGPCRGATRFAWYEDAMRLVKRGRQRGRCSRS